MAGLSLEDLAVRAQASADERERELYFAEMVQRLRGRLSSFLLRKTGRPEDVEDLVQDTFLRAYSNLMRDRTQWRFSTWIFTIATRLAANHYRAQRSLANASHTSMSATDEPPQQSASPAALVAQHQESEQLWATAKSVLSDIQYAVIWLHYARDMSVKEIAAATGHSAIHVRVLMYRARKKLAAEVPCSAP